jgi:hypothetical protein
MNHRSQLGSFSEPRRKKWARFTRILEKIGAGPVCGISRLWDTYGNVYSCPQKKPWWRKGIDTTNGPRIAVILASANMKSGRKEIRKYQAPQLEPESYAISRLVIKKDASGHFSSTTTP